LTNAINLSSSAGFTEEGSKRFSFEFMALELPRRRESQRYNRHKHHKHQTLPVIMSLLRGKRGSGKLLNLQFGVRDRQRTRRGEGNQGSAAAGRPWPSELEEHGVGAGSFNGELGPLVQMEPPPHRSRNDNLAFARHVRLHAILTFCAARRASSRKACGCCVSLNDVGGVPSPRIGCAVPYR